MLQCGHVQYIYILIIVLTTILLLLLLFLYQEQTPVVTYYNSIQRTLKVCISMFVQTTPHNTRASSKQINKDTFRTLVGKKTMVFHRYGEVLGISNDNDRSASTPSWFTPKRQHYNCQELHFTI